MSADGSWNVTINSPMGAQQATLNLNTDGGSLPDGLVLDQGGLDLRGPDPAASHLDGVVAAVALDIVANRTSMHDDGVVAAVALNVVAQRAAVERDGERLGPAHAPAPGRDAELADERARVVPGVFFEI